MGARVRATVQIAASPPVVFDFLDDLTNAPLLLPQLEEIVSVQPLPNGGRRTTYTTRGKRNVLCEWVSEHVEYERPRRTVTRSRWNGVLVTARRDLSGAEHGTTLRAEVQYQVRRFGLGRVIEFQWRRPMRAELRRLLSETKARIEAGQAAER